ncbi:hypothetical protein MTBBW1_1790002 [Desulfamplus magnetovallimortis]|uniref:OmpA-like domain-containing protein n=1 Tax=Desulfamplus magnetovallimortis TaxID=1246637 RepID=A0A1W1HA72_9BACT|nr:OmpA family protein [Desulfamplus magnetovallimortis]SLM29377.1 hypothetical protein MTBBW1_1790002 [Desulfamplus magnetovallimortis]
MKAKNMFISNLFFILIIVFLADPVFCQEEEKEQIVSSEEIVKGLSKSTSKFEFHISGKKTGVKKLRRITFYEEAENGEYIKKTKLIFEDFAAPKGVAIKVEFDVNAYTIKPQSHKVLAELGKALNNKQIEHEGVLISGHTDSDGDASENIELSFKRARSVKEYLISNYDIEPSRLKVAGFGEQCPLVPNSSKENKQKNRRVEVELIQ